jgi:8-oxo-dGTP diphosphatase
MSENRPVTRVAVAVLRRADGKVLFAERPAGKACAGEWEFPGGKIESGETPRQALHREIEEELAIRITGDRPWITIRHDYPHARVLLHFYIVTSWAGKERGREGQRIAWQNIADMSVSPLLAANAPVIRALQLPEVYAISCIAELGERRFLDSLEKIVRKDPPLIQLREKEIPDKRLGKLAAKVREITEAAGARVLVNSSMPANFQQHFSGIHLTSRDLMSAGSRPDFPLAAASCHNRDEIEKAISLGLDFVVLSPVRETASHPDAQPIGLEKMSSIISECPIPVYALGGMSPELLTEVQSHGAHGIAMMRNAWE